MPAPSVLRLQNAILSLEILPDQGGKLSSLKDLRFKREWLLPSQLPQGDYPPAHHGADFSQFDTSGFDECFPNVAAGPAPHPAGLEWPDHGEVWSRPWEVVEHAQHAITCRIRGYAHPYTLIRQIVLDHDTVEMHYTLHNTSSVPLPYLWSAHPLLNVALGMRILLPSAVDRVFVNGASDPCYGAFGDYRPWPYVAKERDFSLVPEKSTGVAVKLFVPNIPTGHCTLWDPPTNQALAFTWDITELPHLGLWLCYGGWPTDGRATHLTVALEPCSGMPDSLDEAFKRHLCPTLAPHEHVQWTLKIRSFPLGQVLARQP